MTGTMKQVVLASYVKGNPRASDFRVEQAPIPTAGEGEILLKTLWLALDPLIRLGLDETRLSGAVHQQIGEAMFGPTVSLVIESNHPNYKPGDIVEGRESPSMVAFAFKPLAGSADRALTVAVARFTDKAVLVANVEEARYYDFDQDYLLEFEPTCRHYEAFGE